MKWIMVFVILPTYDMPGREIHQPFDTRSECIEALRHVRVQSSSEIFGFCVTEENERWYYPRAVK